MSVASITPPHELGSATTLMPLARVSDEDLISLSRGRDDRAFEELVVRYRPDLLRVCRKMMGSADEAEDVLQDVFAAAYVAILADGRPIDCAPWLHRIARNRCLNKLRRTRSVEPLTIDGENGNGSYACEGGISTADKAHLKAELEMVVDDISRLPESQRDALVRYAVGGYSYDQIAHQMGLSLASVRSLLMRARTGLADAAAGREVPCSAARHELEEHRGVRGHLSGAVRQHVKACELCAQYGKGLRRSRRSVLAILPFGPGTAASLGSASGTAGAGLGSAASVGVGALATKAVAGLAVLALAGAGAVVIDHSTTTSKSKPPTSGRPASTPAVAPAAINRHPTWIPLTHHTSSTSHSQAVTPPPHGRAFVRKPPASSLAPPTQGGQPSSTSPPVSRRPIANVSQPQVTRRVRPLPASGGGNTIRTRPTPQATQPPASATPSGSSATTTTQTSAATTTAPAPGS